MLHQQPAILVYMLKYASQTCVCTSCTCSTSHIQSSSHHLIWSQFPSEQSVSSCVSPSPFQYLGRPLQKCKTPPSPANYEYDEVARQKPRTNHHTGIRTSTRVAHVRTRGFQRRSRDIDTHVHKLLRLCGFQIPQFFQHLVLRGNIKVSEKNGEWAWSHGDAGGGCMLRWFADLGPLCGVLEEGQVLMGI